MDYPELHQTSIPSSTLYLAYSYLHAPSPAAIITFSSYLFPFELIHWVFFVFVFCLVDLMEGLDNGG